MEKDFLDTKGDRMTIDNINAKVVAQLIAENESLKKDLAWWKSQATIAMNYLNHCMMIHVDDTRPAYPNELRDRLNKN